MTFLQVILLWLAGLGAATQFAKIAVPFAEIGLYYPAQGDALGWLLSIISLMGAILGAVSGAIAGKIGPLRLLAFGLVLGGAVSLLQAMIPPFPVMLASRIVEGLSHLAIVVAAPTLIAQLTRGRARNAAMVLWSSFFGVAFALNVWIGLPFVDWYGLPAYFALHGILMLVIMALVLMCRIRVVQDQVDHGGRGFALFVQAHLNSYRSAYVSAPAIGWFFYTLTFVSLLAILPGRLPSGVSAQIAGLMPLAGIVLSWLAVPVLLNVMSAVSVVNIGFGLGIVALAASYFGAPLWMVCIGLFSVLGLVQGGSFAAVPQLNQTADNQALSYGALAQMGNAGNLLGTPVLLWVLGRSGEAGMFAAVIGFYAAAMLLHLWLGYRRRYDRKLAG